MNVYVEDAEVLSKALQARGIGCASDRRRFAKDGISIELVTAEQLQTPPAHFVEIEGIRTVSLADLIEMKLPSGSGNVLRAVDLGDVIGLIRAHRLSPEFARHIAKELRPEFRKLARAVRREEGG